MNVVGPGDVVGGRRERACSASGCARWPARLGAEVVRVEAPWGEPLDPDAVLAAHRAPAVIALVHAETSTGVRNDVEAVAQGKGDALLLVDTVTSLGGHPRRRRRLGRRHRLQRDAEVPRRAPRPRPADGGRPGPRAPVEERPSVVVLRPRPDLPATWSREGGRMYHHTAPVSMVFALHAGLGVAARRGPRGVVGPPRGVRASCCRTASRSMGCELVAPADHRLPQLTTVWVPDDLAGGAEAEVRPALLQALRDRDRSRGRAHGRARCGGSAAWATRPGPAT